MNPATGVLFMFTEESLVFDQSREIIVLVMYHHSIPCLKVADWHHVTAAQAQIYRYIDVI